MDESESNDLPLSRDEITLLLLIAQGEAEPKVARSLAVSEATLRRRLQVVQRKLGANSRINAVYLGAKKGLI